MPSHLRVTDKKTVVLSNFELCRDILHGMYMKISSGKRVPCRSAALEILKGGRKFDITTDIVCIPYLAFDRSNLQLIRASVSFRTSIMELIFGLI